MKNKNMKPICIIVLLILCFFALFTTLSIASAETPGFGFVNNTDVALRRGIGGKTIVRLPQDCCVWIKDSRTDDNGTLWYEINAGLHIDYTNVDYTGWMKAEFIDTGNVVWHDVQSVSASRSGLIALKTDGTVESAGSLAAPDPSDWTAVRNWCKSLHNIRLAGFCEHSFIRYASAYDGTYYQYGASTGILGTYRLRLVGGSNYIWGITENNRLLMGDEEVRINWTYPHAPSPEELSHVVDITENGCRLLLLMDDGTIFVSEDESNNTETDWANWTNVTNLEASAAQFTPGARKYRAAYAAVRKDGSVLATPSELSEIIGNWTEMKKIVIGDQWVLGLKQDGTTLSAGFAGVIPPDVSGWTDIVDIGTGYDYCVGVKTDGTMVFAGDYMFMREGHNRK